MAMTENIVQTSQGEDFPINYTELQKLVNSFRILRNRNLYNSRLFQLEFSEARYIGGYNRKYSPDITGGRFIQ